MTTVQERNSLGYPLVNEIEDRYIYLVEGGSPACYDSQAVISQDGRLYDLMSLPIHEKIVTTPYPDERLYKVCKIPEKVINLDKLALRVRDIARKYPDVKYTRFVNEVSVANPRILVMRVYYTLGGPDESGCLLGTAITSLYPEFRAFLKEMDRLVIHNVPISVHFSHLMRILSHSGNSEVISKLEAVQTKEDLCYRWEHAVCGL